MNSNAFSEYNPVINFIFYAGAIAFGVLFVHPAFLLCAVFLSVGYYITIKGSGALKLILMMIPVFVLLSVLNPLVNQHGQTVLFTYLGDRPYTLEALCYGIALAEMFVALIFWFASYGAVMTSDKFIYIFGRLMPAVSLIFTMVLSLLPNLQKKTSQIISARKCIGKAGDAGGIKVNAHNGLEVLSSLTSWALESGIITADSMRSRGYGCAKRTAFSVYRFDGRDMLLMAVMVVLAAVVIFCGVNGAAEAVYVPELRISPISNLYTAVGISAYFVFLSIPTILNITEAIVWRILRSKI